MAETPRLQTGDFAAIYDRQFGKLYRVCLLYLKNRADTEDAVSTVFVKLMERKEAFASDVHETAWLITCAQNVCKNELKRKHRTHVPLDTLVDQKSDASVDETLPVLMQLPEKYKTALYLYYYEGYSSAETAQLLGKKESTVRTWLAKGRAILKEKLTEQEGSV